MSSLIERESFHSGDANALKFTGNIALIKELLEKEFSFYTATKLTLVGLDDESLTYLEKSLISGLPECKEASISVIDNGNIMPPSLKVTLDISIKSKRSNFICFFGSTSSNSFQNNNVKLPLLCVVSGFNHMNLVQPLIETVFGCILFPLSINQLYIKWLYGIAVHEIFKRNKRTEFSLKYQVLPGMDFSCNLPFGELHYLWNECKNADEKNLRLSDLEKFHSTLTSHFTKAYNIKVDMFNITAVKLDQFTLNLEKEVKMGSSLAPLLYSILSFVESNLSMVN